MDLWKRKGISNFVYHDLKSRIFITIVSPYGSSKGDLSSVKSALTEIIFDAKKLNLKKEQTFQMKFPLKI